MSKPYAERIDEAIEALSTINESFRAYPVNTPKGERSVKTKSSDQVKLSDGRTMTLGAALDDGLVEPVEWRSYSRTKEDSRGRPLEIVQYVAREVGGDRLYWEIGKTLFQSRTGRVSIGR